MRKFIPFAAVVGTVRSQDLSAQSCGPVTIATAENFNRAFKDASHVQWVKIKDTFQVRFCSHEEYCLAFFDTSGQLLMSGRKVQVDQVPQSVRKEIERVRGVSEDKYDLLLAGAYELSHSLGKRYFINLESEALSMSILVHGSGQSEILKRVNYVNQAPGPAVPSHFPGACR